MILKEAADLHPGEKLHKKRVQYRWLILGGEFKGLRVQEFEVSRGKSQELSGIHSALGSLFLIVSSYFRPVGVPTGTIFRVYYKIPD